MGRAVLLVVVFACTAGAQNNPRFQRGIAPPVPLMQCGRPEYTAEARVAHLSGLVTMSLTVDDEGMPTEIHVINQLGLGLDESAVSCVSQSRYSPAQKDGKPVPYKISVSVGFQEHWDSDWHLSAALFRTDPGVVRPILVKAAFPATSSDHRIVDVCLHLRIDKNGAPQEVQIASAKDPKLDKEAAAIVGGWRFRPGTQNGQPVDVPATLTLVHGAGNGAIASRERR